jgi:hypothetical protein
MAWASEGVRERVTVGLTLQERLVLREAGGLGEPLALRVAVPVAVAVPLQEAVPRGLGLWVTE